MSESSFDTSVANTAASVTSGNSLGQCIKKTAEESQGNQWFELRPTVEKEWHTLQGEPSSQVTIEEDMDEIPSHVATKKNTTGITNPVIQLLDEVHVGAEATHKPKGPKDPFVVGIKKNICTEVNDNKIVEEPLTMDQLSNVLEKDDSLAQRVQDLLDDNCETLEDIDNPKVNTNNNNDCLTADFHENMVRSDKSKFLLTSADESNLSSGFDLPEMLKQPLPQHETDIFKIINQLSQQSDPLCSFNTSKSTEYGDLPETVDIPPDILRRLNNMRLLDNNGASPKQAWAPLPTSGINELPQNPFPLDSTSQEKGSISKLTSEAPISGNVQYHFGSNPTTPQFPIEEGNLKQLQTYIEKKTGEPSISPLIAGCENVQVKEFALSPLVEADPQLPAILTSDARKVEAPQPKSPILSERICSVETLGVVMDDNERREPEGMSPPVVPSAGTLLASVSTVANRHITPPKVPDPFFQPSGPGNELTISKGEKTQDISVKDHDVDESLADESILARIKSVLSESLSRQHIGSSACAPSHADVGKSDVSFASSIDSLAVQVKALLQEEIDQKSVNKDDCEVNLSEVIENFEQTDLWKYVCQFLPSVESEPVPKYRDYDDEAKVDETQSEMSLNNTLLEKIRSEFEKERALSRQLSMVKTPNKTIKSGGVVSKSGKSLVTTHSKPTCPPVSTALARSHDKFHAGNFINPEIQAVKNPPVSYASVQTYKSPKTSHSETIPGIPDFSRSVFSPTDVKEPKVASNNVPVTLTEHPLKEINGSCAKVNRDGKNVQDQNISLEQEPSVALDWNVDCPKDHDIRVSSFRTEDSASLQTPQRRDSYALPEDQLIDETKNTPEQTASKPAREMLQEKQDYKIASKGGHERNYSATQRNRNEQRLSSTPVKQKYNPEVAFRPSSGIVSPRVSPKLKMVRSSQIHKPKTVLRQSGSPLQKASYAENNKPKTPSSRIARSHKTSPKKLVMQNRTSVHDWLSSPERKQHKARERHLPTFGELMIEQERKEKAKCHADKELDVDLIPTSDKETPQNSKTEKTPLEEPTKLGAVKPLPNPELESANPQEVGSILQPGGTSHISGPPSSLCLEVDENNSYQNLSGTQNHFPSMQSKSQLDSRLSDVEMHRRTLSDMPSSADDRRVLSSNAKTSLLRSLDDFHTLDENVQKQILRKLVTLLQQKKLSEKSSKKNQDPTEDISRSIPAQPAMHNTSENSNAAVCDSDSTEYCELPSSRQTSVDKEESSVRRVLGVDESKAEQIMKRLLKKIERQKLEERKRIGRNVEKRSGVSSSTPEKVRAPLIVPEASSIASTDTDANRAVRYVHVKRNVPSRRKKVTYVEEISSSEPTIVKVKRRHRKADAIPTRVVLHDRSVQANIDEDVSAISHDIATNFPSPVYSKARPKRSKSVQTRRTTENKENISLNDTITIDQTPKEVKGSVKHHTELKDPEKRASQRFSSFFVDFANEKKKKSDKSPDKVPVQQSLAWYEPFSYQPPWMDTHEHEKEKEGLIRITLQEALSSNLPEFVSKSRARQRKIAINAEERRLQEVWAEERQRVFGVKTDVRKPSQSTAFCPFKRRVEMSRRQVIEETREKYQQLPEVIKRKQEEERKRQYATNRLKAQVYKKKIQNKVLGKIFAE